MKLTARQSWRTRDANLWQSWRRGRQSIVQSKLKTPDLLGGWGAPEAESF